MTTATALPALTARPGWVARRPGGALDHDGLRAAYFDAAADAWIYVGRAFSRADRRHGLAQARAELRTR